MSVAFPILSFLFKVMMLQLLASPLLSTKKALFSAFLLVLSEHNGLPTMLSAIQIHLQFPIDNSNFEYICLKTIDESQLQERKSS
jgi:hypothetical protein